jgi:hypothetical protein
VFDEKRITNHNRSFFFGLGCVIFHSHLLAIPVEEELKDDDGVEGERNSELKSVGIILRFLKDNSSASSGSSPVKEEGDEGKLSSRASGEILPDLRHARTDVENDSRGRDQFPVLLAK